MGRPFKHWFLLFVSSTRKHLSLHDHQQNMGWLIWRLYDCIQPSYCLQVTDIDLLKHTQQLNDLRWEIYPQSYPVTLHFMFLATSYQLHCYYSCSVADEYVRGLISALVYALWKHKKKVGANTSSERQHHFSMVACYQRYCIWIQLDGSKLYLPGLTFMVPSFRLHHRAWSPLWRM